MNASAVIEMTNQDALIEDLESDPFLNSAFQRFTCELYCRFSLFLAPLTIGLITSRHYLAEHGNKNGGISREDRSDERTATPNKYEGLGSAGQRPSFATMTAELSIGSWFGTGAILAIRMVNSLDYCIEELISRK